SALSKVTDGLIRTMDFARAGDAEKAAALVTELLDRHIAISRTLITHQRAEDLVKALRAQFDALGDKVTALAARKSVTPADHDEIVATGELASSRIAAAAFQEQHLPAAWVDARDVLVTDAEHMVAAPN